MGRHGRPRFVDAYVVGITIACAAGTVITAIAGVWLAAGMLGATALVGAVLLWIGKVET